MANFQIPSQWVSKKSKDDQINELNSEVRCTLKPSPIQGIGVFAIRDIPKGERCYCRPNLAPKFYNIPFGSLNKLFSEVRELVLAHWASVANGSLFQSPNSDVCLLMFMNHSCNPNYDVVSDVALRDIEKNEELLENYTVMENWAKVRPIEKNPWLDCEKMV